MKYLLFIISLGAILITAGCSSPGSDTVQPTTPAEIVTSAVTTTAPTIPNTITQIPTTISPDCDMSGSCTDLARRMEESLSDCSIYGRNDPQCLSDKCNMAWIEALSKRCPKIT
jgi:hypothetical protein